jgi:hypothetical protein
MVCRTNNKTEDSYRIKMAQGAPSLNNPGKLEKRDEPEYNMYLTYLDDVLHKRFEPKQLAK